MGYIFNCRKKSTDKYICIRICYKVDILNIFVFLAKFKH